MPRAGLSEARVVSEAESLVDALGLSRLTIAALAARLGVRQPSLYKHIDGIADLQRSIAVRAKSELADVLARAAAGRACGDALTSIAHAYREWAAAHPGRYAAMQRAPVPGDIEDEAASRATVQVVTDVLGGYELRDDDAIDAVRALRAALHGFVALEASNGFGLPVDVDRSFDRLVRGLVIALSSWADKPIPARSRT